MAKSSKKPSSSSTAKKATPKSKFKAQTTQPRTLIDPKMLGVLVCPKTKGPLVYDSKSHELISKQAKLAYSIRDGVPILLVDSARKLEG